MPRPPRFHIAAIQDLLEQLRYAPADTRRREMDAAEALLREINPEQNYPEDYVVFRITAYRPELTEQNVLMGEPLQRELGIFIERLSDSLKLSTEIYAPRVPLSKEEAAERLGVGVSTLTRYRKRGLVAHQIVWPNGKQRLGYFADAVDHFAQTHSDTVNYARTVHHLTTAQKDELFRRARRYQQSLGLSLNETAGRLAPKFNRSKEAVRQLLKRHDARRSTESIFAEIGPMTNRLQDTLLRAHDRCIPVRAMVSRYKRSRPTLYRVIHQSRARRLQRLALNPIVLPTFQLDDAADILLSPTVVRTNFNPHLSFGGEATVWVADIESRKQTLTEEAETAWFGALNFLLHTTAEDRFSLDKHHPAARELDVMETRLRWAVRLKARIIDAHLPSLLSTLQVHLGHKLLDSKSQEVRQLHRIALRVASRTVDQHDPTRGNRFAALLQLNLSRALAQIMSNDADPTTTNIPGRAVAKAKPKTAGRTLILSDMQFELYSWQPAVDLREAHRFHILRSGLSDETQTILNARFGLETYAPQTCVELANEFNKTPEQIAAIEYRAQRVIRAAVLQNNH